MAGRYERGITILEAIRKIDNRSFLLPAIQRNFVWSPQQICTLFDSLMRTYPINTFMMWDVTSPDIKNKFRFYSFLTDYCQRFKESNDYVPTQGDFQDFKAVIDGQQRLTSIYIGLKGTYATKKRRVWWPSTRNDEALPPRKLYLDLAKGVDSDENEALAEYCFQFLTKEQLSQQEGESESHWFEVGEVLQFPAVGSVDEIPDEAVGPYLEQHNLQSNKFARKTLNRLYYLVRHEEVIYSYIETSQDIDHVLDVFIRTNSGGTPLAFSDLLMSIAIANWKGDARKDIDDLVTEVRQSSEMQFSINRDWVLKSCLMLTGADVKFRVKNFDSDQVGRIQDQWSDIRACVVETFKLLRGFGLSDQSLRAKNAIIPLAYYLYKQECRGKPLYAEINNHKHLREERLSLSRWLHMALLRGIFGSQADTVLGKVRRVLDEHLGEPRFPLDAIIEAFRGTNKDMRFDEDYLRTLLDVQYGDPRCRSVLSLLYPEINENLQLDMDHLHPQSAFTRTSLAGQDFLKDDPDLRAFYQNQANWNSLVNLHLLNASQNRSKKGQTLSQWMADKANGFAPKDILLTPEVSLEFADFKAFCEKRRHALLERLRRQVVVTETQPSEDEMFDDEEVGMPS